MSYVLIYRFRISCINKKITNHQTKNIESEDESKLLTGNELKKQAVCMKGMQLNLFIFLHIPQTKKINIYCYMNIEH